MPHTSNDKRDFFISYNRADQTWAEWVGWQLEAAGYKVFIQAWDFRPGHNFVLEMNRAATLADRTVPVLSPNFLASRFTAPEWAAAFADDPTGEQGRVVPVRVAECDAKGLLGPIVYIDLVGRDEAKAKDALLRGVRLERVKPLVSPVFPGSAAPVDRSTAAVAKPARFPGTLPLIWNVPYLRNPHFSGRDELLENLHQTLTSGPTALNGMGGIGKTQLALEYTYRHHTEFDLVWWLRSEEPRTLLADYAALAGELRLPEAGERELAAVAQAVRRTLERRDRWLLVFDNVPEEDDLRDLLPRGGGGRVLITSRNPSWDRATALAVPLLTHRSSVAFLLKRTGQGDETAATALAAELGDLPLALEQAAAFIVRRAMPLADYLTAFRARRKELWRREEPPQDYPDTVRTTWSLAVARLRQEEPAAVDLLDLGAFLAPEAIPRWLFAEHREALPPPLSEAAADSLRWGDVVEALRSYSLVGVGDGTITFHRLVQAATRDGLAAEDQRRWTEIAVQLMNAAPPRPAQEHTGWSTILTLFPHALAATEAAQRLDLDQYVVWLFKALGEYADHAYKRLSTAQQVAAKHLFLSLVTPSEGLEDTRARITLPADPTMLAVVEIFSEAHLIITSDAAGSRSAEISHEALIYCWNRLRCWVDENRELLRTRAALVADRAEWLKQNRHRSLLIKPRPLLEAAHRLRDQQGDVIIDDIKDYIDASLVRNTRH